MPIFYAPDEDILKGVRLPPRSNQEVPDNSEEHPGTPSDTTSDGDTDDDFLSAESLSSLSDDDTPEDDNGSNPENTMDNNDPDPSSKEAPESDSPPQEGPGDNTGEGTSNGAATSAAVPNSGGNLSRKARTRAPVRRQRSVSHPPSGGLKWKDRIKKQLKE